MNFTNEELIVIYEALSEYLTYCKWTFYKSNAKPSLKGKARKRESQIYLLQDRIMGKLSEELLK